MRVLPAKLPTPSGALAKDERTQNDGGRSLGPGVTGWTKDQAELLRRIALAGGSYAADECQGAALDALVEAGFVTLQAGDRIALTDAGLARASQLSPAGLAIVERC